MTQVASFHDCDVVIVKYNAGKVLADCVSSVFAASAARAIVVDSNSMMAVSDIRNELSKMKSYRSFAMARTWGLQLLAISEHKCHLQARFCS